MLAGLIEKSLIDWSQNFPKSSSSFQMDDTYDQKLT